MTINPLIQKLQGMGAMPIGQEPPAVSNGGSNPLIQKLQSGGFKPISQISGPAPQGTQNQTMQTPGLGSVLGFGGVPAIENAIPGMKDFATGAAKSVAGTVQGAMNLGTWGVNKIGGLFGMKPFTAPQLSPSITQPTNTVQSIGKTAGDIAQFFIPGGAEAKAGENLSKIVDAAKFAEKFGPEAGKALEGILKVVGGGAITGASMGAVSSLQEGKPDVGAAIAGGVAGVLGKALEVIGPGITKSLMTSDFKLSATQEAKASQKAEGAAQFMTDNKILGSETTKYSKLDSLNSNLESTLQSSLPKDIQVPKSEVYKNIDANIETLRTEDPAIYQTAKGEAEKAKAVLASTKGNYVSVDNLLKSKRSWGQAAFKTTKFAVKDPRVSAEGAYAAELGFQKALSDVMDLSKSSIKIPSNIQSYFNGQTEVSLKEFNKIYSTAISAKNLTYMSMFKKDSGLVGRLFSLWAGSAIGEAILPGLGGKLAGATVGELSSTHLPGILRNVGERIGVSGSTPAITGTKATLGILSGANSPSYPAQQ